MKDERITEEQFDRLSDFQARKCIYCNKCGKYHLCGSECPCDIMRHLKLIQKCKEELTGYVDTDSVFVAQKKTIKNSKEKLNSLYGRFGK